MSFLTFFDIILLQMKNKIFYKIFRSFLMTVMVVVIAGAPIVRFDSAMAYTQSDLTAAQKKAAAAAAAAAQKKADAAAMQSRISSVNSQIDQINTAINVTAQQITSVQSAIAALETQIQDKQSDLDRQQEQMSNLIASWYMEGQSGLLETVVGSDSLSQIMDKQQYYESLRQQIQTNTDEIKKLQDDLNSQKNEQAGQLQSLNDLKSNQASQKSDLQTNLNFKTGLLANDQAAAASYDQQAAAAQAEANTISLELRKGYCLSDGGTWNSGVCSKSGFGGPAIHKGSGGVQLNVPYYSQQDSAWRDKTLGASGVTIGDMGCLMTSLAMVDSYFGLGDNPATLVSKSSFILSGSNAGSFMGFNYDMGKLQGYEQSKGYVDLNVIDSQLRRGNPVIVKVWTGNIYHWITITGGDQSHGYSWNDPWPWRNPPVYTQFYNMRTFD